MLIFLHGPDTFRSRQKLKAIKNKFSREVDPTGLNTAILAGESLATIEFEKAISTPPFLAKKRLVVVENLLGKNKGKKIFKEVADKLKKADLADVILIFWEQDFKSNQTNKDLFNRLKKADYIEEFKLLDPAAVQKWAKTEINRRSGTIAPSALTLLVEVVGNDLWQLNSEIDKLIAHKPKQEITVEAIKTLVQTKLDDDIFKLTNAIGQRQKKEALRLIADQLKSGTSPTQLLAKIIWQFRNLLLIKLLLAETKTAFIPKTMELQLGLHPFVVKKTISQAQNYLVADLKKIYNNLIRIEYKIKTSQVAPEVLLDLLIVAS